MAILSAMQSAALVLVGRKPANFFGSSEKFEMEITDLINEVAEDVARYQDWEALQSVASLAGDGAATSYPLPLDYSRMLKDSPVRPGGSFLWGYRRLRSLDELLVVQAGAFGGTPGGWIISGGRMQFAPAPSGTTVFPYIVATWADGQDGRKSAFTADSDNFLLPERLLKLGLIWRWRENKKLDASGDQEAFVKALDEYAVSDGGSRVYRYNGRSSFPGTHLAWPGLLGGTSDTIGNNEQWDQTQW